MRMTTYRLILVDANNKSNSSCNVKLTRQWRDSARRITIPSVSPPHLFYPLNYLLESITARVHRVHIPRHRYVVEKTFSSSDRKAGTFGSNVSCAEAFAAQCGGVGFGCDEGWVCAGVVAFDAAVCCWYACREDPEGEDDVSEWEHVEEWCIDELRSWEDLGGSVERTTTDDGLMNGRTEYILLTTRGEWNQINSWRLPWNLVHFLLQVNGLFRSSHFGRIPSRDLRNGKRNLEDEFTCTILEPRLKTGYLD